MQSRPAPTPPRLRTYLRRSPPHGNSYPGIAYRCVFIGMFLIRCILIHPTLSIFASPHRPLCSVLHEDRHSSVPVRGAHRSTPNIAPNIDPLTNPTTMTRVITALASRATSICLCRRKRSELRSPRIWRKLLRTRSGPPKSDVRRPLGVPQTPIITTVSRNPLLLEDSAGKKGTRLGFGWVVWSAGNFG